MVGIDRPFVIIGEKINPTGRKKLAAALTERTSIMFASWPRARWRGGDNVWL